ncbi:unnamed protein product, partial [Mesorhabditis spiculigera]
MGIAPKFGLVAVLLLLNISLLDAKRRRWKRQALPSTHVQVHSLNSNVSVADEVHVVSAESRIDLKESFLNASIWSSNSELLFNNFDTYVNYTAFDVEDIFNIHGATISKEADKTEFSMVTNRSIDGNSRFNERLEGSISLRVNDSNMGVQALNGTWAIINGETLEQMLQKKISVYSDFDPKDNTRKLLIKAVSNSYDVKVILSEAEVQIEYGPSVLQIDKSYRHMKIFTEKRNITLDTITSPFEVAMTEDALLVTCKDERTTAQLSPNNTDVEISVGQYSILEVDRGDGVMSLGDSAGGITERVNITSMQMRLDLEDGLVTANSNRSHIDMMGNLTKVSLTAAIHNLTVSGGVPRMKLDTGNITVQILAVEERAVLPSIVPPFEPKHDNYDSLGPVAGEESPSAVTSGPEPPEDATTEKSEPAAAPETTAPPKEEVTTIAEEVPTPPEFSNGLGQDPFGVIVPATTTVTVKEPSSEEPDWTDVPQPPELVTEGDGRTGPEDIAMPTLAGLPEDGGIETSYPRPDLFTTGNPGLSLFATISSVDFNETPAKIPVAPGSLPFPTPQALHGSKKRSPGPVNDALVMRLYVPDSVNISDPLFMSDIEASLVGAVRESVQGIERFKRNTGGVDPIDVDLKGFGRDGDAVSLQFVVFSYDADASSNHSAIAEAMNSLGRARLSQDMHYPVVEVVHVNLNSTLMWFLLTTALFVLTLFCILCLGWKFGIHNKLKKRLTRVTIAENRDCQKQTL